MPLLFLVSAPGRPSISPDYVGRPSVSPSARSSRVNPPSFIESSRPVFCLAIFRVFAYCQEQSNVCPVKAITNGGVVSGPLRARQSDATGERNRPRPDGFRKSAGGPLCRWGSMGLVRWDCGESNIAPGCNPTAARLARIQPGDSWSRVPRGAKAALVDGSRESKVSLGAHPTGARLVMCVGSRNAPDLPARSRELRFGEGRPAMQRPSRCSGARGSMPKSRRPAGDATGAGTPPCQDCACHAHILRGSLQTNFGA
jgi:hypothetical protein